MPRLVMIQWVDSTGPSSQWQWLDKMEKRTAVLIRSVGWLLEDGPDEKVIAAHLSWPDSDGDQQTNGLMVIPSVAVKSIVDIEPGEPSLEVVNAS